MMASQDTDVNVEVEDVLKDLLYQPRAGRSSAVVLWDKDPAATKELVGALRKHDTQPLATNVVYG